MLDFNILKFVTFSIIKEDKKISFELYFFKLRPCQPDKTNVTSLVSKIFMYLNNKNNPINLNLVLDLNLILTLHMLNFHSLNSI